MSEEYLVSLEGDDPGEMEGERDPPREVKPERIYHLDFGLLPYFHRDRLLIILYCTIF